MRVVRPVVPAEAVAAAAPEPLPQPPVRAPHSQGEEPGVSGVRQDLPPQG